MRPLPISDHLKAWYGSPSLPTTYLVIDTETTGLDPKTDVVLQVGYMFIKDGEEAARGSMVLNWVDDPRVDLKRLLGRLETVRRNMTEDIYGDSNETNFNFDVERLRGGMPPNKVFRWVRDYVFSGDLLIVGHFLEFDERMLSKMLDKFLFIRDSKIPPNRYFDTHGFTQASCSRPQVLPTKDEEAKAYFRRACRTRRPTEDISSFKLTELVKHFGWDKSGMVLLENMHNDALEDVKATNHLYQLATESIAPSAIAYQTPKGTKAVEKKHDHDWD